MYNFSDYTTQKLVELINVAAAELASRTLLIHEPKKLQTKIKPVVAARPNDWPTEAEEQHLKLCLHLFKTKGFVRADDVKQYRAIVSKYANFANERGFPDDCRGSSAARWSERQIKL